MRTRKQYPLGTLTFFLALLYLVALPGLASAADTPADNPNLALPADQFWTLLIGSLVPLGGYVINYVAPWCDEKVKAIVQVLLAAIAGALYKALDTGDLGLNSETLQLVFSSVIAALFAHRLLWAPSGINLKLGASRNLQTDPHR